MTSAKPLQWVKLWDSEFFANTDHLDDAAFRAYMRLFCAYWRRQGLPNDLPLLRRLAGLGNDPAGIADKLVDEFFTVSDSSLRHDHLDKNLAQTLGVVEANKNRSDAMQRAKARKKLASQPESIVTTLVTTTEERGKTKDERGTQEKVGLGRIEKERMEEGSAPSCPSVAQTLQTRMDALAASVGYSSAAELKRADYRSLQPRQQSALENLRQIEYQNWSVLYPDEGRSDAD